MKMTLLKLQFQAKSRLQLQFGKERKRQQKHPVLILLGALKNASATTLSVPFP